MISVIIPTRNGERFLPALLQRLETQTCARDLDIRVVDSSSTDATRKIARQYGAHVLQISAAEFDHGATRSMAAKMAEGELIVFLTQDAVPVNEHCISRLIAPLQQDDSVAVSYGRQLPRPDASLFGKHLRAFNYGERSHIRRLEDSRKLGLKTVFVSNSCAAYKKTALEEIGYFGRNHLFAEDACAVGHLLQRGYRIAYVAEAMVYHSHNYSIGQEFKRYFDVGAFHRQQHWLLETFGTIKGEGGRYVRSELQYILKDNHYALLPSFFLRNLMKLAGYKLGYYYTLLPKTLPPCLSMNPAWWKKTENTTRS